ncbi:MAG TPA: hypothetical protein VMD29_00385 [Terracidiphilus sp.]|nr:hypothetical protein [Terracidiphilus sp.]
MDLWTEFEGVTIDSAFSLKRLLQTEGRSAFFSTINASGESVLIRLIECHFDEDEILARWRGVQSLGHPNFLRIDRFGQFLIEADGITAVYVVFERVDAHLTQVLEKGKLSAADAAQIGLSVASALETLHANGWVHEHIEPQTIFAVGESVKLRSDCIRETPEGAAGEAARRRDVRDLAVVLTQVLLGVARTHHLPAQPKLPVPFDQIVSKGMSGEWGLAEIQAALRPRKISEPVPKVPPQEPGPAKASPPQSIPAAPHAAVSSAVVLPASSNSHDFAAKPFASERATTPESSRERPAPPEQKPPASDTFPGRLRRDPMELPVVFGISQHDFRRWMSAVGLFLAVVLFGWFLIHRWSGGQAAATAQPAAAALPAPPSPAPSALPQASQHAQAGHPGAQARTEWRVVAFTYNRENQAQKKASSLAQKYPALQPEVFSPNGRAPWLVTLGGALEHDAAYALARKARSLGLPRDTYAQNYAVR